jgi:hypothetical protein
MFGGYVAGWESGYARYIGNMAEPGTGGYWRTTYFKLIKKEHIPLPPRQIDFKRSPRPKNSKNDQKYAHRWGGI